MFTDLSLLLAIFCSTDPPPPLHPLHLPPSNAIHIVKAGDHNILSKFDAHCYDSFNTLHIHDVVCSYTLLGTNSLAASMNLSVWRIKKTGGLGLNFGLPMRVKRTLPSVKEPVCDDDLDGISALESTVDESQQSCQSEVVLSSQEKHPTDSRAYTVLCSSGTDKKIDQKPPTGKPCNTIHSQGQSKKNDTGDSLFTSQTTHCQLSSQEQNSSMQEASQSFATSPPSATPNNNSRLQQGHSKHQQTIPTPQGSVASSSNTFTGSGTLQRQNSSSLTPVFGNSGSFIQHPIPQVNQSGQLQAIPGHLPGTTFTPGVSPDMQYMNPMVHVAPKASMMSLS